MDSLRAFFVDGVGVLGAAIGSDLISPHPQPLSPKFGAKRNAIMIKLNPNFGERGASDRVDVESRF